MKKKMIFALFMVVSLLIAGCSPNSVNADEYVQPASINLEDVSSDAPAHTGNVEMPSPGGRSSEAKLIHDVSLDLSKRLGLDISGVTLVESLPVTWTDGGLGCPAADTAYTQAEIEGYQITLEANSEQYLYHSQGLNIFIYCNEGVPIGPSDEVVPPPGERSSEAKLIHDVSLDLSQRLGIDISGVTLVESAPVTWPDGGLGCSVVSAVAYDQVEIEGFKIILEANGKQYVYHTQGLQRFVWCNEGTPVPPTALAE
ncbi:MAG: hypothetical protein ABFS17_06970 [Chloroflexota bacterium]